ncbi:MAG: pantoate--beta-alanine ligase [Nitrospirae bacterium]|nr:pantoate--beta-alanine ligase [Nitrospirota bacterium]
MEIIRAVSQMHRFSRYCRESGKTIGFVPTMGALHEGHISLVNESTKANDITVVSIFINPAQFSEDEDFERYPRDYGGDIRKLRGLPRLPVDALFMPSVSDIYPDGYKTYVEVRGLSERLCGGFRPGHFTGVATVVLKLFNAVMPVRAYFGLKDYQQCVVIKKMVRDLNLDMEIVTCPTLRDHDGLAKSSRNIYLSAEQRPEAALIYRAMAEAREAVKDGTLKIEDIAPRLQETLLKSEAVTEIQYASAYDPRTLKETTEGKRFLIAVAVKIGTTRLIDNLMVEL